MTIRTLFFFLLLGSYGSQVTGQQTEAVNDSLRAQREAHLADLGNESLITKLRITAERAYADGVRSGELGAAFYSVGRNAYRRSNMEESLRYGRLSADILKAAGERVSTEAWANVLQSISYLANGQNESAYERLSEAVRLSGEAVPEGEKEYTYEPALFRIYLARSAVGLKKFDEASVLLEVAETMYRDYSPELKNAMEEQHLLARGFMAAELRDSELELEIARQTVALGKRNGNPVTEHAGHSEVVMAKRNLVDHDSIDYHVAEMMRLTKLVPDDRISIVLQRNVSATVTYLVLDTDRGRFDRIDSLRRSAEAAYANSEFANPPAYTILYKRVAEAYHKAGKLDSARLYYDKAANYLFLSDPLYGEVRLPRFAGREGYAMDYGIDFLQSKRAFYLDQGNRRLAYEIDRRIDTIITGRRHLIGGGYTEEIFRRQSRKNYDLAILLCIDLYRETGEPNYLHQAITYVERQKGRLLHKFISEPDYARQFRVSDAARDSVQQLQYRVTQNEALLANPGDADQDSLRSLTAELYAKLETLSKNNASRYPEYTRSVRLAPDLELNRFRPPGNTYLVDYYLGDTILLAFIISPHGEMRVEQLDRPADLTQLTADVLRDPASAASLYRLLLDPVLAEIPESAALLFLPDGELWRVPFAALRRGNTYLIEKHPVSYAYSLASLGREAVKTDRRFLGFGISYGNPVASNETAVQDQSSIRMGASGYLRYAGREVSKVASIMGGNHWLEEEVTPARFKLTAEGAEIIHLAMHGIQSANPLASGLLFHSDSVPGDYTLLTMGEVLQRQIPSELVTLSACHSGHGPLEINEGAQSIARAFTFAGARSTLASNWEANDEITYRIVTRFYERLAAGEAKNVALQSAIVDFLSEASPAERDPRNWANLVLTGEVRPLPSRQASYWPWLLGALILAGAGAWAYAKRPA